MAKTFFVQNCTRAQLETLTYPCGQHLLFLDQFLQEFSGLRLTFDIKIETSKKVIASLRQTITEMSARRVLEPNITFLLWSKDDQDQAERLFPEAQFFAQDDECWRAGLAVILGLPFFAGIKKGKAYAIPPKLGGLSLFRPRIFKAYHHQGAKVIAYLPTCNEDARAASAAGADFILSDRLFLNQ